MATPSMPPVAKANRPSKQDRVAAIRANFEKSSSAVLLDYTGIDVATVTALRNAFRKAGVKYLVSKNKLFEKALVGTKLEGNAELKKILRGPTGIAWSFDDPSIAAKTIKAFRKEKEENEKLTIKAGVLDTTILPGARVESDLAGLPGKNEVRAQLLATLMAPMEQLVRTLNAPAQDVAYVLTAREKQLGT